jgi:hypothetical protein
MLPWTDLQGTAKGRQPNSDQELKEWLTTGEGKEAKSSLISRFGAAPAGPADRRGLRRHELHRRSLQGGFLLQELTRSADIKLNE